MKNSKLTTGLFFLAFIMVLGFTSCSNNNDDNEQVSSPKTASFSYAVTNEADLLAVADVTVRYLDETGKFSSEKVTSTTWSKTFNVSVGQKAVQTGIKVTFTPKSGVTLTKDTYTIKGSASSSLEIYQDGKRIGLNSGYASWGLSMNKDKVSIYLPELEKKSYVLMNQVDKDGNISKGDSIVWP